VDRFFIRLALFLVLLATGWAARPLAWDSLMRVKAAAEQGNPEAQYLLGLQYKEGDGIEKNRAEAVKWLRKSAESGYVEAQYALGDFYAGLDPTDDLSDPREAEKWLKAAAQQGNAAAQSRLDVLRARVSSSIRPPAAVLSGRLEPGEVIEEPAVTVHWSELLSGLRGAEAFLVRGFLLENGIYVNRDVSAAAAAFRGAAIQGDARGQRWLGAMYAAGRGVPQDAVAAMAWEKQAAGKGNPESLAALIVADASLSTKDDPAERDKWSLVLSGLRGPDVFLVRGFVLENGIQVSRDLSAAADFYRLAGARGDARGKLFLGQLPVENLAEARAANDTAAAQSTAKSAVGNPVVVKKSP